MEITAQDAFRLGGYYERLRALEHDARNILHKYGYDSIANIGDAISACLENNEAHAEKKPREPKARSRAKAQVDTLPETTNGQPEQPDDTHPTVEALP